MTRLVAAGMLALMAVLMWHAASIESQTYDEATHLAAGYSYWKMGDFRLNPEHPPLSKLLQAAPLLAMGPELPTDSEPYQRGFGLETGELFVHHNRVPAAQMLAVGRAVTIGFALLLGVVIFWWAGAQAGAVAGLAALGLYVLDPNFLAHGHYVTSDVAAALTIFVAAVTWMKAVRGDTRGAVAMAGIALGLALATKFSALFLVPVHLLVGLVLVRRWETVKRFVAVVALAVVVVALSYGPATVQAFLKNPRKPLATLRDNHPYAIGVKTLVAHNDFRQPAYLLGEKYRGGKWQYFPVAFAVKTPVAALAAFLFIAVVARRYWMLLVYPAAYFAITMAADLNIGLRHILPVYPFLYALAGVALAGVTRKRWRVMMALAAVAIFETARIHPDHIAFFNVLAGGPENGPNLLLDSNIDWGQDLLRLKAFLAERGTYTVAIQYFGGATPEDYGMRALGLPGVWDTGEIAKLDGWAAISVTNLYDVYFEKPTYTWLREKKPTARVGRSIYVYDLRKGR